MSDDFYPYDFRTKGPTMTQPTPAKCPKCSAASDIIWDIVTKWTCGSVQDATGFHQSDRCKIEQQRQEIAAIITKHYAAQAAECELCGRGVEKPHIICGDCECECSALQQRADAAERENKQLNQECRDRLKAELEAGNRLTAATRELEALRGAIERFRDAPMTERDAYDNLIAALHPARPESKAKPT